MCPRPGADLRLVSAWAFPSAPLVLLRCKSLRCAAKSTAFRGGSHGKFSAQTFFKGQVLYLQPCVSPDAGGGCDKR